MVQADSAPNNGDLLGGLINQTNGSSWMPPTQLGVTSRRLNVGASGASGSGYLLSSSRPPELPELGEQPDVQIFAEKLPTCNRGDCRDAVNQVLSNYP